jgi:hypothetical protein
MNLIRFFHTSKWPYKALAVLCLFYALFSFYELVIQNKTPFKIEAEGIVLDLNKKYYFTNYKSIRSLENAESENSVLIRYKKNEEWMPNHLGTLYYDGEWKLDLNKAIQHPVINKHPFLPYCRSVEKSSTGSFNFYDSGQIVSEAQLTTGLIFNYPTGSVQDREYLNIKKISGKEVLYFEDDGIGVSYQLPDKKAKISAAFNSKIRTANTKGSLIFKFDDTTPNVSGTYNISYTPNNFLSASIEVKDQAGNTLYKKLGISHTTFQIENILLSLKINQMYGITTIFIFLVQIILIAAFLFYFIGLEPPAYNNPIQSSILKSRIIMNCLMLLGTALFIKTFGYYTNSPKYDLILLSVPHLFNISYWFVSWWKKLKKVRFSSLSLKDNLPEIRISGSIMYAGWMVFFFILIPVIILLANIVSNERVLGIPALHFQKVIIILAYFVFASELVSQKTARFINNRDKPKFIFNLLGKFLPKNVLILFFSIWLSYIIGDYGSILFVAIAIIMIEVTLRRIKLKEVAVGFSIILGIALLVNQIGIYDGRKLYRLLYSFLPPDSNSFAHFNQADRESISYIWFNLKSFMESFHMGLFNDLKILEVSKSVAHSDYAFHWSLMLGGVPFLLLVMACLSFLLTHLFFIFKSTLLPMKVGKNTYLSLARNKYTIIISFWLAITIVQFVYQLFSNNMLFGSILSGIPFPFISVRIQDYFFLGLLFVGLEILFYSNSFKADFSREKTKAVSSNYVFISSFRQAQYLIIAFLFLFGLKGAQFWFFDNQEIHISAQPPSEEENSNFFDVENYAQSTQDKYIQIAKDKINELELTNLPIKTKKSLKPVQYAYYNADPIKEVFKIPFELKQDRLEEIISWKNHFDFSKKEISGENKPFGTVYAKKILVNDNYQTVTTNPYYRYLNLNNDYLNLDLSAELNRLLKSHVQNNLADDTRVSVVVLNNEANEYVATSQYPNTSNNFVYYQNYYIGSIKKALLLDAALNIDFNRYIKFQSQDLNLGTWIKYSNYDFAGDLLEDVLNYNFEEFDRYLAEEYNTPFYSVSTQSYSDRPKEEVSNVPLLANGGLQKYPIANVLQWYRKLALKANKNDRKGTKLNNILTLPLETYGTASVVGKRLKEANIDTDQFIAKTGTLEENGKNISSSFIIANQQYTIGVMMVGDNLPFNESGLTAKYIFAKKVVPLLIKYSIFKK